MSTLECLAVRIRSKEKLDSGRGLRVASAVREMPLSRRGIWSAIWPLCLIASLHSTSSFAQTLRIELDSRRDAIVVTNASQTNKSEIRDPAAANECVGQNNENARAKLDEALAYDRGPGGMVRIEMERMIQSLIDNFSYDELKTLLRTCSPKYRQGYLDPKHGILDIQLKRSRLLIYENVEQKKFYRLVVLLTGIP